MAVQYSDDYLEFYGEYPRHEGKAEGQKAWNKLSDPERRAALADVRKRKRLGAYSSNKKLIQLPASYLNARRWDDDWEDTLQSSRKGDNELPNTGGVNYEPIADNWDGSKWLSLANRWAFRWFFCYGMHRGGLDTDQLRDLVAIKNRAVAEMGDALDEQLQNDSSRESQIDAIWTFLNVLVDRLDQRFEVEYKPILLNA